MADSIFGVSEKALKLSEERAVLISNNIVNSATPHYQAKDIDFHHVLQETAENQANTLKKTDTKHLSASNEVGGAQLKYRVPMQTSLDGNTVDDEIERKNFIQNAMSYQLSLTNIKSTTDRIVKAFRGD